MLLLSRKPGQKITIPIVDIENDVIEITVIEIRGDRVRLGFRANPEIEIFRNEIYVQIQAQEAREAAQA